jgi:hypothetical protein
MKTDTIYAVLIYITYTGVIIVSGRVGLKFLLNNAQRHIIDL